MNVYEAAFEEVLALSVKEVTLINQTPILDENNDPVIDANQNIVYESSEILLECTLSWKNSVEKTDHGYSKSKVKDVIGKFRKRDIEYLKPTNEISYTSKSGRISKFTISDVIEREGHIEVSLT